MTINRIMAGADIIFPPVLQVPGTSGSDVLAHHRENFHLAVRDWRPTCLGLTRTLRKTDWSKNGIVG